AVGAAALAMAMSPDEQSMYVLLREPKALAAVDLDSLKVTWRVLLPEAPAALAVSPDGKNIALSSTASVRMIDVNNRQPSAPMSEGDFGAVQFVAEGKNLAAANLGDRRLSIYDTASQKLLTHLPVVLRPDRFCLSRDNGQLFITGDGLDAV